MGKLLFSVAYLKLEEKLSFVITKGLDLHIEDELAVLGKKTFSLPIYQL